jgi:putative RNA 2'-phosphotransferase
MAPPKSFKKLSKYLFYMLGCKPEEFGLVPDADGFIKIKELLKAIHEEDGLKYVRRSHIEEILISAPDPPIEIKDNLIRAKNRDKLPLQTPAEHLPRLLFTCVRRRAYPVVLEKGIFPSAYERVVLSSSTDLALRMGKRIDPDPVLLTVQTDTSMQKRVVFYGAGETLFLADSIPTDCFSGPLLQKQKPFPAKPETPEAPRRPKHPGSYLLDLKDKKNHPPAHDRQNRSDPPAWKKDKKKRKKQKLKKQRPPWRS